MQMVLHQSPPLACATRHEVLTSMSLLFKEYSNGLVARQAALLTIESKLGGDQRLRLVLGLVEGLC